jgi:hypothetical protein
MASGPDYYFEAPTSEDLEGIFEQIAQDLTRIAATETVVTDVLPEGIHYIAGSAAPPPTTVNGQTLTWSLGTMTITDTHTIVFDVSLDSRDPNQLVDLHPDSRVDYTDYRGEPAFAVFPETRVSPVPCEPWEVYLPGFCKDCCDARPKVIYLGFGISGSQGPGYEYPDGTTGLGSGIEGGGRVLDAAATAGLQHQVAVIGSNHRVHWKYPSGSSEPDASDLAAARAAMESLVIDWGEGSDVHELVKAGLDWFAAHSEWKGDRHIIIFDDADHNRGPLHWPALIARAKALGVKVHWFWTDTFRRSGRNSENRAPALARAQQITSETGGVFVEVRGTDPSDIDPILQDMFCGWEIPEAANPSAASAAQAQSAEPPAGDP